MLIIGWILLVVFYFILTLIAGYCILQFYLSWAYTRKKNQDTVSELIDFPLVCVQLPVYNEKHVIERLIDSVCKMDYPKDRLEIQVLDDSNDPTTDLAERKALFYRTKGYQIEVIRRPQRLGFKAGALDNGLQKTTAEFIAIFDADFIPSQDFLKKTIPHFTNQKTAVVQTRWGHINRNYNLITILQAFQLNVHFSVEQTGRYRSGHFLQFNGTAGIWRKTAIHDAGGWSADTLTEDLDLSYRVQLKGWKILYLEAIESPAELPAEMSSFKAQQYRWMKGGAETAFKILPRLWKSDWSFLIKLNGTAHLLGSSIFLLVLSAGILSWPVISFIRQMDFSTHWMGIFFSGFLALIIVYFIGNYRSVAFYEEKKSFNPFSFVAKFICFLSLSMGMSLHNSKAVWHGYTGKRTPFVRTPKFALSGSGDNFAKSNYLNAKIPSTTFFELILAVYFLAAVIWGVQAGEYAFVIYHLMLSVGFATIGILSIRDFIWQSKIKG